MATSNPIDSKLLENVLCPAYKNGKPQTTTRKVKGEEVTEIVTRKVKAREVISHRVDLEAKTVTVVTDQGRKYAGPIAAAVLRALQKAAAEAAADAEAEAGAPKEPAAS